MMLIWMVYVMAVSLLLGLAALAAEQCARLQGGRARWYWLAAIIASLLLPAAMASVSVQVPRVMGATSAGEALALRDVTHISLSPKIWMGADQAGKNARLALDPWIKGTWGVTSVLMLMVIA